MSDGDASAERPVDESVTGDEPMTGAQRSHLETLTAETGLYVPDGLTKAQASELIDQLERTSRARTEQDTGTSDAVDHLIEQGGVDQQAAVEVAPDHGDPTLLAGGAGDLSDDLIAANVDGAGTTVITVTLPRGIVAEYASVVGDFNEWDPHRGVMKRDETGAFSCSIEVIRGQRYQYRFLLDGDRWVNDDSAHSFAPNEFGGEDSVLDLSNDADRELAAARERQAERSETSANERPEDAMAPLINNTGDDGGAATG